MAHPLAIQVEDLARPLVQTLGYELVQVVFHTNQLPPIMRVDIRPQDPLAAISHEDCERVSRALDDLLEASDCIPGQYLLEISSPGLSEVLATEKDFAVFKGFPVEVQVDPPYKGKPRWQGNLLGRDEQSVMLSLKGRSVQIPRGSVQAVILRSNPDP